MQLPIRYRTLLPLLCLSALLLVPASAQAAQASGDFNGDGRSDLAVGVPFEDVGEASEAGAVNVLYGSAGGGLAAAGDQQWNQDRAGVEDVAEFFDNFGSALAAGDFNGDGFADLAVAAPFESIGSVDDAGAVNVLYGSAAGLTATGDQLWHQDRAGVQDTAEAFDFFGQALTSGDFNGDGRDDLAVGVPHEGVGSHDQAGAANVLYGSAGAGLTASGNQIWHQDRSAIADTAEDSDLFGFSLAAGDLNGDGRDDLAAGVPFESIGTADDAGATNVIYGGSGAGLSAAGNQIWHQDRAGVEETAEGNDHFGDSLAIGDFNGDSRADLAAGVPNESIGGQAGAGAANVLYGSPGAGLAATGDQLWHQDRAAVEETAEPNDDFGAALAAGDLNGDGKDDLAAGVPHENTSDQEGAGAANVLYGGTGAGLTAAGDQLWHQDRAAVEDTAEFGDAFGTALTVGDFNGDGKSDLAAGVPGESLGDVLHAGAANVLYGGVGAGLTAAGDQLWHQDRAAVEGEADSGDHFGAALASGAAGGP